MGTQWIKKINGMPGNEHPLAKTDLRYKGYYMGIVRKDMSPDTYEPPLSNTMIDNSITITGDSNKNIKNNSFVGNKKITTSIKIVIYISIGLTILLSLYYFM